MKPPLFVLRIRTSVPVASGFGIAASTPLVVGTATGPGVVQPKKSWKPLGPKPVSTAPAAVMRTTPSTVPGFVLRVPARTSPSPCAAKPPTWPRAIVVAVTAPSPPPKAVSGTPAAVSWTTPRSVVPAAAPCHTAPTATPPPARGTTPPSVAPACVRVATPPVANPLSSAPSPVSFATTIPRSPSGASAASTAPSAATASAAWLAVCTVSAATPGSTRAPPSPNVGSTSPSVS